MTRPAPDAPARTTGQIRADLDSIRLTSTIGKDAAVVRMIRSALDHTDRLGAA